MNDEEFILKFYSCDNEEQFLKDVNHNLNCLRKLQNNWNELKKWLKYKDEHTIQQNNYYSVLSKMQELDQGKDE